jgi:hypothetical protein
MVDYWAYTGDESYVNVTRQALMAQFGENYDIMMPTFYYTEVRSGRKYSCTVQADAIWYRGMMIKLSGHLLS